MTQRKSNATEIIRRLQPELAKVNGITLYMQPVQDLTVEDRVSRTQYQYSMEDADAQELAVWATRLVEELRKLPSMRDVATDQQNGGLKAELVIDRDTASRLGILPQAIDDTLYDAFGQRQVSTIFTQLNQYHVVLEVDPQFSQNPDSLKNIYVHSNSGMQVPLASFSHFQTSNTALAVNHQGQFPVVTLSFNLAPGRLAGRGDASDTTDGTGHSICRPASTPASRERPRRFRIRLSSEPLLILAAHRHRLHRAGRALRELHSSRYDSFHAAFGGRGRDARAAA